jgi:hypothetical protein
LVDFIIMTYSLGRFSFWSILSVSREKNLCKQNIHKNTQQEDEKVAGTERGQQQTLTREPTQRQFVSKLGL